MRIQEEFENVADNVEDFQSRFKSGMSAALEIDEQYIDILGMAPGSIVVDFILLDAPRGVSSTRTADEAAMRLEGLMTSGNYASFPSNIRNLMAQATVENIKYDARVLAPAPGAIRQWPIVDGYAPPAGCLCLAHVAAGIRIGCGRHMGLLTPWCPVQQGCPGARTGTGAQSRWAYCERAAPAPAALPGNAAFENLDRTSSNRATSLATSLASTFALLVSPTLLLLRGACT